MVRPRTPRRQPGATVRLLERLVDSYGHRIEVATFGCPPAAFEQLTEMPDLRRAHRGMLSRAEVAELLRAADVFADHSTYQAFGRTALEAMACGCVPVVPAIGGAWEFAESGVNALVCDTLDENSVHTAVAQLVDDAPLRKRLREAGLHAASRYSVERAAMSEFALFASRLLWQQLGNAEGRAARVG
jgi:glycosyltransferase involved in cell wall biosynthesis